MSVSDITRRSFVKGMLAIPIVLSIPLPAPEPTETWVGFDALEEEGEWVTYVIRYRLNPFTTPAVQPNVTQMWISNGDGSMSEVDPDDNGRKFRTGIYA